MNRRQFLGGLTALTAAAVIPSLGRGLIDPVPAAPSSASEPELCPDEVPCRLKFTYGTAPRGLLDFIGLAGHVNAGPFMGFRPGTLLLTSCSFIYPAQSGVIIAESQPGGWNVIRDARRQRLVPARLYKALDFQRLLPATRVAIVAGTGPASA